jgi:hypothetical protein
MDVSLLFCIFVITHLKTEIKLNYIQRPSLYRAINTLHLGYKKQSVNAVYGQNIEWERYQTDIYKIWWKYQGSSGARMEMNQQTIICFLWKW